MLITPGIHLVLGGKDAIARSDDLDCMVYGIETSEGIVLIDAGAGRDADDLARRIAALPAKVIACCLTHAHADHSGGAFALAELGIPLLAGAMTKAMVESADEIAISLDRARQAGIYPSGYAYQSCKIDRMVSNGEVLSFGDTAVTVIPSPGHSCDHMAFLVRRPPGSILASGDSLFEGGRVVLQDIWDCSVPLTCRTIEVLAQLEFDVLLPGHGACVLLDGRAHAAMALGRVKQLLPPLQLV